MKSKFCGYVINSVDYKENDSIVTILSQDGLISFKARGTKKINSKMNSILFNYAYSEFEVNKSEKSGYLTLLDGRLLNYPSYVINNLEYMAVLEIISDGINKSSDKSCLFTKFKDSLKMMELGIDSKLILVAFLNYIMDNEGIKYEGDCCVNCLNRQVVSFDFDKGGFLCKNCSTTSQSLDYLKNMRILTKIDFENVSKINFEIKEIMMYIERAFDSLLTKCGIEFKGKDFLFKVINMEGNYGKI